MRKFFGILAFVAVAFGFTACEQNNLDENGTVVIYDGAVSLVDQGFGMYYGDKNHNLMGAYTVVLSDAVCCRDGFGEPYLDSEGDMLVLEFLTELKAADAPLLLPEGEYVVTKDNTVSPRINTTASYVKRLVGTVQYEYMLESGSFRISKNSQGTYDVETKDLVIKKGNERHDVSYSYSGDIELEDWSKVAAQIQDMKSDIVDMPFSYVSSIYYGNLFGYGTGNYVVNLATEGFMEDETGKLPGVCLVLNMFGELVPGSDTLLLPEGTYTVYPEFNYNEFSMLYGMNMDGVPFGTYVAQVDAKGNQSLEFINGGTVEVTRESINYEDVYTLKYTLNAHILDKPSRKVTGVWVGPLHFDDQSQGSGRIILSTLDGDVDCDMHRVERGVMGHIETLKTTPEIPLPSFDIADVYQLWLEPRGWTKAEMNQYPWNDYKPEDYDNLSEEEKAYVDKNGFGDANSNGIKDRLEAWNPNGDVMILEFVVPFQANGNIAVDMNVEYSYQIQPNLSMDETLYSVSVSKMGRPYDDIFYEQNWTSYPYMTGVDARRGFTYDGGFRGNWYMHYDETSGQKADEHAPAVKGTVKVTRTSDYTTTEDGRVAEFKFVWDLFDDAEASYNIKGEWSGPVVVYDESFAE